MRSRPEFEEPRFSQPIRGLEINDSMAKLHTTIKDGYTKHTSGTAKRTNPYRYIWIWTTTI